MSATATAAPRAEARDADDTRNAAADAPSTVAGLVHTMLTRSSPRFLGLMALGFGLCRALLGGWSWVDAVVPAVLLAWWPFQEWLIHTYLLHFRPRKLGPIPIDFAQAKKHRRHHQRPWDFGEISIPVGTFVYVVPLFGAVAWFGQGAPAVLTGLTAFCALALHYEWCHFMSHSNYVPRTRLYKAVWKHHRLHHFKNETLWMGVSMRAGDILLGTSPDPKQAEKSSTCRTLGIEA